jgi:hypothetical protein
MPSVTPLAGTVDGVSRLGGPRAPSVSENGGRKRVILAAIKAAFRATSTAAVIFHYYLSKPRLFIELSSAPPTSS